MVLYILTGYRVLGIVYLDQLTGARQTHTYHITTHQCHLGSQQTPSEQRHNREIHPKREKRVKKKFPNTPGK